MLNNKFLVYLLLVIAAIAAISGIYNLIFNSTASLGELIALIGIVAGAIVIIFNWKKRNGKGES